MVSTQPIYRQHQLTFLLGNSLALVLLRTSRFSLADSPGHLLALLHRDLHRHPGADLLRGLVAAAARAGAGHGAAALTGNLPADGDRSDLVANIRRNLATILQILVTFLSVLDGTFPLRWYEKQQPTSVVLLLFYFYYYNLNTVLVKRMPSKL